MPLSDCEKCWDTPCMCGWYWRDVSTEGVADHIFSTLNYKSDREIEIILKKVAILLDKSI